MTRMSTLCYLLQGDQILMLHRTVKEQDVNHGKWIGVGGHFEADESPEECLLREVWEETGYTLTAWRFRGIVTFVSGGGVTEYMHLFTADGFNGEPHPCNEGELAWLNRDVVWGLNLWEGDRVFFRLLMETERFFSLKLMYDGHDRLAYAALNGKPMELFDVLDENGRKTGVVRERGVAHRDGSLHGTVHMWIVRRGAAGPEVLLQRRAQSKDSNPGCYDISSAGHIAAGGEVMDAAVREMREELGLSVRPEELHYLGQHRGQYQSRFHGHPFWDNELSHVFVYTKPVTVDDLTLQPEEVAAVRWMGMDACLAGMHDGSLPNCIYEDELEMVRAYLGADDFE